MMKTSAFLFLEVYNMRGTVGRRKFSADWRIIRILFITQSCHGSLNGLLFLGGAQQKNVNRSRKERQYVFPGSHHMTNLRQHGSSLCLWHWSDFAFTPSITTTCLLLSFYGFSTFFKPLITYNCQ
jgi:hypothetical protein